MLFTRLTLFLQTSGVKHLKVVLVASHDLYWQKRLLGILSSSCLWIILNYYQIYAKIQIPSHKSSLRFMVLWVTSIIMIVHYYSSWLRWYLSWMSYLPMMTGSFIVSFDRRNVIFLTMSNYYLIWHHLSIDEAPISFNLSCIRTNCFSSSYRLASQCSFNHQTLLVVAMSYMFNVTLS